MSEKARLALPTITLVIIHLCKSILGFPVLVSKIKYAQFQVLGVNHATFFPKSLTQKKVKEYSIRMNSPSSDGFWATLELLVDGLKEVTSVDLLNDDIEDWLDTITTKVKLRHEREKKMKEVESHGSESDMWSSNHVTLIDCSFSSPPVRSRLEMLMGSNIVRLTDRKYMLRLMARLRQDYETRQQCRIEERKKNELMRTKTMILNRLISVHEAPAEIRQYPLFQLYLYCDAIVEQKRKKHTSKQKKMKKSLYNMLYPDQKKEKSNNEEKEIYMKRIYVDGVPELIPMTEEEAVAAKKELEISKDVEDGYMLTQKEYDRIHYETEAIKDLRGTQKVEEMYAKAHDILGILYSYVDEGRYKKQNKLSKIADPSTENRTEGKEKHSNEILQQQGNSEDNANEKS
ncbi:uncharacterized protein [Chelonus insularis]|uniref:uncharacterized protein n=1 Tax=Chelonus insularis TaxID=460826 RepID=UPI001589A135|nr:uncharacterized protein LOC118073989 [Chelonus insularis]